MQRKLVTGQGSNKTIAIFKVSRFWGYHEYVIRLHLNQLTIIQYVNIKSILKLRCKKIGMDEVFYLFHLGSILVPVIGSWFRKPKHPLRISVYNRTAATVLLEMILGDLFPAKHFCSGNDIKAMIFKVNIV